MSNYPKALTDRAEKEYVGIIKGILLQKDINAGKDNYTGPGSGLSEYAYQLERIVDSIRDEDTLHGIVLLHRLIMAGLSEIGAGKLVEEMEKLSNMEEMKGISGCSFGDTDYDSLSTAYGYNTCLGNLKSIIFQALASFANPGNEQGGDDKRESKTQSQAAYDEAMKEIEDQELSNPK